jgi:hypothetical protein
LVSMRAFQLSWFSGRRDGAARRAGDAAAPEGITDAGSFRAGWRAGWGTPAVLRPPPFRGGYRPVSSTTARPATSTYPRRPARRPRCRPQTEAGVYDGAAEERPAGVARVEGEGRGHRQCGVSLAFRRIRTCKTGQGGVPGHPQGEDGGHARVELHPPLHPSADASPVGRTVPFSSEDGNREDAANEDDRTRRLAFPGGASSYSDTRRYDAGAS